MLRKNKHLQKLELEGNNLGAKAAADLAEALRVNTTLRYLCAAITYVLQLLVSFWRPRLRSTGRPAAVDMGRRCCLGTSAVAALDQCRFAASVMFPRALPLHRSLHLDGNNLGLLGQDQTGLVALAQALGSEKASLEVLSLTKNAMGPAAGDAFGTSTQVVGRLVFSTRKPNTRTYCIARGSFEA